MSGGVNCAIIFSNKLNFYDGCSRRGEDIKEGGQYLSIDQFNRIIEMLDPCMDDFLYIYDLKDDLYCVSGK